jgi:uncharacterized low-complexity protein
MKQIKKTTIATALGAVVIGSLASVSLQANASPFGMQTLDAGYMQSAAEGKCGGDKAKAAAKDMKEGKCGEGKCGGDKAKAAAKDMKEGKCGGDKAKAKDKVKDKVKKEGKCGEGKCGGQA